MALAPRHLLLLLATLGTTAAGQGIDAPVAPAAEQVPVVPEVTLAVLEANQRLTVPVAVGANGPFRFIIDTGSERSVVSRELASHLQLVPGKPVTIVTMTERTRVGTVIVPDLGIPAVGDNRTIEAPALEGRYLGATGLLGLDTLEGRSVLIDFEKSQMAVRKARKRGVLSSNPDEIVVTAKSRFGQLIITKARYGNMPIDVVLDTGSQVTVGNMALARKIAKRKKVTPINLISVTGRNTTADYTMISDVRLGGAIFSNLPIAFADATPFQRFGLNDKPALMLGMDALRLFRKVEIDFANRQVRLLMPRREHDILVRS